MLWVRSSLTSLIFSLFFITFFPGPGSGAMSNSKRWKEALPTSFRSPYVAQGDLGFFSSHGKQYGAFYLAVNTYSGLITVTKIPNTKMETLILAVGKMTKVIIWRGGEMNHAENI